MDTTNQIPSVVASIIEKRENAAHEERRRQAENEQRQQQEWITAGTIKYDEWLGETTQLVPAWIRPYLKMPDVDFERIGKGWDSPKNYDLYFAIPGLTGIVFDPEKKLWKHQRARWDSSDWDGDGAPVCDFKGSSWNESVDNVLLDAKLQFQIFQEYQEQHQAKQADQIASREKYESQETERERLDLEASTLHRQKEQAEELALFNAIKNDPVVISLLKAFVLIRDERSSFEQQVSEMDESLYSMENRWSRRAEELRRQADDAQRRADDERSRLQSDLDDAESKLKKAQRGW